MKRLISGLLALTLAVSLSGCASDTAAYTEEKSEDNSYLENETSDQAEESMNSAEQIGAAEYPETVQFPREEDYSSEEDYMKAVDEWYEQSSSSPVNNFIGVPDSAKSFFTGSIRKILKAENSENRNYSPVSLYLALSMLAEAAGGQSREEILSLLGCSSIEEIRETALDVWLSNYQDDGITTSILGNSVWLRDDMDYDAETAKNLADYYFASAFRGTMGSPEYDRMLQEWIKAQTGGLLDEQADNQKFSPETVFRLISSVYFKDRWVSPFEEMMTSDDVFHGAEEDATVPFMHDSYEGPLYTGESYASVYRNLNGGERMWIILPREGYSVDDVLEGEELMDMVYDPEVWEKVEYYSLHLSIPRFDVVSDLNLSDAAKELGIASVFSSDTADLSSLLGEEENAAVSEIRQTARIRVDENGCEATAFTTVEALGAVLPEYEDYDFKADRPFIYVLTGVSGMPLFIGVVNTLP